MLGLIGIATPEQNVRADVERCDGRPPAGVPDGRPFRECDHRRWCGGILRGCIPTHRRESVHALSIDKLRQPGVTLWSGWIDDELVVIGALKRFDAENGRDQVDARGAGMAGQGHRLDDARSYHAGRQAGGDEGAVAGDGLPGMRSFPRLKLYESAGFVRCAPFSDYTDDPFSVFMMKAL